MTPRNLLLLALSGILLAHCVSSHHSITDTSRPVDSAGPKGIVTTESKNLPRDMASADQRLPPPADEPYLPPAKAIWSDDSIAGVDTWRAMSEHMTFAPDATGPSIDLEMQKYRDNPRVVTAAAERASLYLPYVTRRLMESDFPPELALLPFLESAYDPHAISASGAAGLWQIQPGTGDVLGLKRDQWYDGRQDVVRSTDAVIGYFGHLHQVFDGDWLLALAAFNSGEGTVSKAIQRNIQQGKNTDFWALDLPDQLDTCRRARRSRLRHTEAVKHRAQARYHATTESVPNFNAVECRAAVRSRSREGPSCHDVDTTDALATNAN